MLVNPGREALDALERAVEVITSNGCDPPPGDLGEMLLHLGSVVDRLAVLRATWSQQFEAGGQWALDGARSGASWVAARAVEHPGAARGRVHAGRDLAAVPQMARAAARGEVRLGHVRLLVAAARAKPHRWARLAEVEGLATSAAAELPEPAFARYVQRWAALVDAAHDSELRAHGRDVPVVDHGDVEEMERRELFLSRYGSDGMWALSGRLDTETGLALSMALESICEAIRSQEPDRGLAQLRHDALGVLVSGQLSAGLPVHKGVRPHLVVVVRQGDAVPALVGPAGPVPPGDLDAPSSAELLDRGDADLGQLVLTGVGRQRLGCDAVVQRLTVDASGIPLALGRSARVVPPALRRVIDLRDRHCTFAGCTAPAMWCQAHHLVHWEEGGPTDERNLALTCTYHHRVIHAQGFGLGWSPDGRRIQTHRPDGSVIALPNRRC
jgi:hypothetical protein